MSEVNDEDDRVAWRIKKYTSPLTEISSRRPHVTGHAVCCCCGHDWVAVYPATATRLECPECQDFTRIKVFVGDNVKVLMLDGKTSDDSFEAALRIGILLGKRDRRNHDKANSKTSGRN